MPKYEIKYRGTVGGPIEREFPTKQRATQWLRQIGRPELIPKIVKKNPYDLKGRKILLYRVLFRGRLAGAIGKSSTHSVTVSAISEEDAILKLYDKYEHIQQPRVRVISSKNPVRKTQKERVQESLARSAERKRLKALRASLKVGDRVRLHREVLKHHSQSIPAHAGYTTEGFQWRKTLDELEGKVGVIERIFDSGNMNVDFDGHMIGINYSELVKVGVSKNPASKSKRWTIAEIVKANKAAGFYYFDRSTMKYYGQTLKMFKVKQIGDDIFIYAKAKIYGSTQNHAMFARFFPKSGQVRNITDRHIESIADIERYLDDLKRR